VGPICQVLPPLAQHPRVTRVARLVPARSRPARPHQPGQTLSTPYEPETVRSSPSSPSPIHSPLMNWSPLLALMDVGHLFSSPGGSPSPPLSINRTDRSSLSPTELTSLFFLVVLFLTPSPRPPVRLARRAAPCPVPVPPSPANRTLLESRTRRRAPSFVALVCPALAELP
jgi:hypothetical protein